MDERRRCGRVRRQRMVAPGAAVDHAQRGLDPDRGNSLMADRAEIIDLSHVIEHGMTTYKGLPGPHICDFWTRDASAANYDDGSTFQIGRIDMVANTGTYLDTPFHRYEHGDDLAAVALDRLAALPGLVVRTEGPAGGPEAVEGLDVAGGGRRGPHPVG